jgi:hypothetical protein
LIIRLTPRCRLYRTTRSRVTSGTPPTRPAPRPRRETLLPSDEHGNRSKHSTPRTRSTARLMQGIVRLPERTIDGMRRDGPTLPRIRSAASLATSLRPQARRRETPGPAHLGLPPSLSPPPRVQFAVPSEGACRSWAWCPTWSVSKGTFLGDVRHATGDRPARVPYERAPRTPGKETGASVGLALLDRVGSDRQIVTTRNGSGWLRAVPARSVLARHIRGFGHRQADTATPLSPPPSSHQL